MGDIIRAAMAVNAMRSNARKEIDELLRDDIIDQRLRQTDGLIKKRFNKAYKKNQLEKRNDGIERSVELLHVEVEKRLETSKNYRNLLSFLVFIALYLAVLFRQRDTEISYSVESALIAAVYDSINAQASVGG